MEEQEKLNDKPLEDTRTEQATEEINSTDSPATEACADTADSPETEACEEKVDFAEFKQLIDAHFAAIKGLIRYSKEKDANVLTLSKQLQSYRDGFENTLFKRIAMEFIEYRERSRKSLRELEGKDLGLQQAEKYIGYLKLDFEDLLENLNIKIDDNGIYYNKKDINGEPKKATFGDIPQVEDVEAPNTDITCFEELAKYLQAQENAIAQMIKNNTVLDLALKDYIAVSASYEEGLYQVVLYPVIRRIAKVYSSLSEKVENAAVTEENATQCYAEILAWIIDEIDAILEICNVTIDPYVSDVYDPKKQRILKMIETDNAELNGHVIKRYSDCYIMEEKTIYLSKVDVYKAKQNQ